MVSCTAHTTKAPVLHELPWSTHPHLHHRVVETGDGSASSTIEHADVQRLVFARSRPVSVSRHHDHSLSHVPKHLEGDQAQDAMAATRREPVVSSPSRI